MKSSTHSRNILVVDDDPSLLELLVDTLQTIGHTVTGCSGGNKALIELKKNRFDLMISDIKMPDMDGIQLLRKVRRHYSKMPVLFITGVMSRDIIGQVSPDGFLAKPFRISQIEELIENTMNRKSGNFESKMPRVLIVSNDEKRRTAISEALQLGQYLPFDATDATDAMQKLENGSIDMVVADQNELLNKSKKLASSIREHFPNIKIILTRAGDSTDDNDLVDDHVVDAIVEARLHPGEILSTLDSQIIPTKE